MNHAWAGQGRQLARAERIGLVPRTVRTLIDAPRMAERELQVLDRAQVRQLLDAARGNRLEALYVLANMHEQAPTAMDVVLGT